MHLAVLLLSLDLETAVHVPSCDVTKSARTPVILLLHVLYVQYASLKKASRNMTNHAGGDDLVALDIDRRKQEASTPAGYYCSITVIVSYNKQRYLFLKQGR